MARWCVKRLRRLLTDDDGPTAVEYAVLLGLIASVMFIAISNVGSGANTVFQNVSQSFSTGGGGGGGMGP